MAVQIQLRRGTAAAWTAANTILADGEAGFETDTKYLKFGDGVTAWIYLDYSTVVGTVTTSAIVDGAVTTVKIADYGVTSAKLATSITLAGTPTAPTAGALTSTLQVATTEFATTADNLKANIASPTFTGTPAADTATVGTSTTQLATTAFVATEVAALVAAAPAALNTLNELALALGSDANFSTTVTNSLSLKAPIDSPTFTGTTTLSHTNITGALVVTGRLDAQEIREYVVDSAIGVVAANVLTANYMAGNIYWINTAPSANFTIDLTNPPSDDLYAMSITVVVLQGATGYIPNGFQVDGSVQTLRWSTGTTPTPTSTASKLDVFSFTLIRRAAAWVVIGSAVLNF